MQSGTSLNIINVQRGWKIIPQAWCCLGNNLFIFTVGWFLRGSTNRGAQATHRVINN